MLYSFCIAATVEIKESNTDAAKKELSVRQTGRRYRYVWINVAIALTIALHSSYAYACIPLPDAIPELEAVKQDLEDGNYGASLDFLAGLGTSPDSLEKHRQQMQTAYPDGFDRCETVLSENLSPKFREELVLLGAAGKQLVFLYWQVVNFDGRWAVVSFNLTTQVTEVLDARR